MSNEPTYAFENDCLDVIRAWRSATLSFGDCQKILLKLLREAQTERHIPNQARAHFSLGFLCANHGRYDEAFTWSSNALRLFQQVDNPARMARAYLALGEIHRYKREFSQAQVYYQDAYVQAKRAGDTLNAMFAQGNAGHIANAQENYELAQSLLEDTLAILKDYLNQDGATWAVSPFEIRCEYECALAEAYLGLKKYQESWHSAVFVHQLASKIQRPIELAYAYRIIAQILTALGHVPMQNNEFENNPTLYFEKTCQILQDHEVEGDYAETLLLFGKSLAQQGQVEAAMQKFHDAALVFTRLRMFKQAKIANDEQLRLSRET